MFTDNKSKQILFFKYQYIILLFIKAKANFILMSQVFGYFYKILNLD